MTPELDRIYIGDCLSILQNWPDSFIQTCVTSPPYWGLRDYGTPGQMGLEKTPAEYVAKMVEVFREVRRVLKDDGTLWLNLGDSYTSGGRSTHGTRVGYKQESNAGCLSVQHCRPDLPDDLKPKDLCGIPWRVAFAFQADGWTLRSDIIWSKPNPMPESVTDRPTKSHEYLFLMAKSERYYYDAAAIREPGKIESIERLERGVSEESKNANGSPGQKPNSVLKPRPHIGNQRMLAGWDTGPGSHTKLIGNYKLDKQRGHGRRHAGFNARWDAMEKVEQCSVMRNKRSVWAIATMPYTEAHFATFPPDLIRPPILAGSAAGDIVLDPFMGAGTTALVAAQYDRRFLGIELNAGYVAMAEKRIAHEMAQVKMAL